MNRFVLLAGIVLLVSAVVAPALKQPATADSARLASTKPDHVSPWGKAAPAPASGSVSVSAEVSAPTRIGSAAVVEIARDAQGQFHLEVDAGGQTVRFLVDTGADVVALTEDDADRMGIRPDASDFRPILRTASGAAMAAPVQIAHLTIGGHDLDDVKAVVVPDLTVSLLGQSALRRLGSITLRGDRLIITG